METRPDDPQAQLFCGGKPCDTARVTVSTQRSSFLTYLAVLAGEGACFFFSARQAGRVDSSAASALATGCGLLGAIDVVVGALGASAEGMFLKTRRSEAFELPVNLRFGATALSLDASMLRTASEGPPRVFDVAKTLAFARAAGAPLLCRAMRDPQSGGTFAARPLAYEGVVAKDATPVVEKLRDHLAQDLAPAHPVGPGKPADLFLEGKLSAGFKLELRVFDGRSRYVVSSAEGSAPTLAALADQVPRMLNDLYGSCINESLVPVRLPPRMR